MVATAAAAVAAMMPLAEMQPVAPVCLMPSRWVRVLHQFHLDLQIQAVLATTAELMPQLFLRLLPVAEAAVLAAVPAAEARST